MTTDNAQYQDTQMNELIAVQKIAGWEKLKALVLDSVSSPITKRVYNMALNEFLAWVLIRGLDMIDRFLLIHHAFLTV